MKLFYYPAACSLADHIALIETGLPYGLSGIDREKKTEDGRDFLSINPKGYIPALELEDGTILTENQIILNYIAERSGKLLPEGGIARWRTLEALAFMSSEIHTNYAPFFRDFPEPEKVRAREKLKKAFAILADQMGQKQFLIADEMTIADCYLFWVLMVAPKSGVELPENLQACFDRMRVRSSVIQAFAEEGLA
ncbi:glutathione binding-like protein [Neorhizobium sp. Rsf11]|uniref:Glutathione binding-like protein n=2 Tax=Neorhizobium TaxID=1525371 RepID=A0ABV0LYL8_9HYPH|nr:glutathione binding-like protein [Neorhizobium petrolearium]MCC2612384.1 glutathione S-transferase N-terminal domain-containing protein [Neorhizobium petrolearium]WGI67518.1 glutathione binding-like protein [Neorhizobium petrolearium]